MFLHFTNFSASHLSSLIIFLVFLIFFHFTYQNHACYSICFCSRLLYSKLLNKHLSRSRANRRLVFTWSSTSTRHCLSLIFKDHLTLHTYTCVQCTKRCIFDSFIFSDYIVYACVFKLHDISSNAGLLTDDCWNLMRTVDRQFCDWHFNLHVNANPIKTLCTLNGKMCKSKLKQRCQPTKTQN